MARAIVDVAKERLANQLIDQPTARKPVDVVRRLGAVQAQDYLGSLWAVGLRQLAATEASIEAALADRTIIRTWPMRGTLHFVAAEDARWMLELLTPRVIAKSAARHRQLELDASVFATSGRLFVRALEGGKQLPRTRLYEILNAAGIATTDARGLHILAFHAQQRLICFGPRQGKQQTFALFDDWVPRAKSRAREDALAELAIRYFGGHGPATLQDFAWWSGLSAADARTSLELAQSRLTSDVIGGRTYWSSATRSRARTKATPASFLPPFDEFTVAYRDRSAVLHPTHGKRVNAGGGMLNPTIVIGGRIAGTWKRTLTRESAVVTVMPFTKLTKGEERWLEAATERYGVFLGLPAKMKVLSPGAVR